jgi:molecular chaperone DnaK (HSP70)
VKFLIDANGILQVAARDLKTGTQQTVEVQPSYGLSDAEVEKMLEESIEYAEQDFTERQTIEARNEAETILRATEKSLTQLAGEAPGELPETERLAVNAAVSALREAVASGDYKLIRARVDELNQATLPLAERMMNRAVSSVLTGKRVSDV